MSIEDRPTQPGLFDHLDHEARLARKPTTLDQLNDVIPWDMFRGTLKRALRKAAAGPGGRPPFDRVLMFKILVLQSLYDLSDAEVEFQIEDRSSFRRFLGLTVSDRVPDEKTVWAFRNRLGEKVLHELMQQFLTFLAKDGVELSQGRIIDATFCQSRIQRNTPQENAAIKKGRQPESWKDKPEASLRQKDTDARWGRKYGYTFGYKHHICIDADTKLITGSQTTAANVHDSNMDLSVIDAEARLVYADRGYDTERIRTGLGQRKITTRIPRQRHGNQSKQASPISPRERRQARLWNRTRSRVEHVFGAMKMSMKGYFFRGVGARRAEQYVATKALTYNFLRGAWLLRRMNVA